MPVQTRDFLTPGDNPRNLVEVDVRDGLTIQDVSEADRQWEGPMSDLVAKITMAGLPISCLPPSWSWTWAEMLEGEITPDTDILGLHYAGK